MMMHRFEGDFLSHLSTEQLTTTRPSCASWR